MSREKPDGETRLRDTPGKKIYKAIDVLNEMKNEIQEEKRKYIRALKDYQLMSEKRSETST